MIDPRIENRPQIDKCRSHNRDYFTFGEASSYATDVYLTGVKICDTPSRDVSVYSVPGRNGDIILDNGRWKNLDVTYSCAIATNFDSKFAKFKSAMLNQVGYKKLWDTIHPETYRKAILKDPIHVDTSRKNFTGRFDITFNCKPQRFLLYGDEPTTLYEPRSLHNKYGTVALPTIIVYGSGPCTLTVGDTTVEIKELDNRIYLDSDTKNAYRPVNGASVVNLNHTIHAYKFPELVPGENMISWTGDVTCVAVAPRWWIL